MSATSITNGAAYSPFISSLIGAFTDSRTCWVRCVEASLIPFWRGRLIIPGKGWIRACGSALSERIKLPEEKEMAQPRAKTPLSAKRIEFNKSLQPTPGSGSSSAARFTSLGPAWLSLDR